MHTQLIKVKFIMHKKFVSFSSLIHLRLRDQDWLRKLRGVPLVAFWKLNIFLR